MKNKKVYGLLGVAALAVVGGTFAYYNSTDTFVNQFDTTNHGTSATEQFDPSKGHDWVPGAEVDKSVYATNTGDGDVWVRIKFNEAWTGLTSTGVTDGKLEWDSSDWGKFQPGPALGVEEVYEGYSAGDHQADTLDENGNPIAGSGPIDGLVARDAGSVVYKVLNKDNLTTSGEVGPKWYYNKGYFYYCQALTKEAPTTVELLQKVKLCGDTDMGKMTVSPGYFTVSSIVTGDTPTPKPDLNDDGTLKSTTGWYNLLPDGSVPTKKVEEFKKGKDGDKVDADGNMLDADGNKVVESHYYIPVILTDDNVKSIKDLSDQLKNTEDADTITLLQGQIQSILDSATAVQDKALDAEEGNQKTVYTYKAKVLSDTLQGYANANYNLDITVEFVQADEEAAKAFATGEDKWVWNPDTASEIK